MRFPLQVGVLTAVLATPCSRLSQADGNQAGAELITLIASRLQAGEFDKRLSLCRVQECHEQSLIGSRILFSVPSGPVSFSQGNSQAGDQNAVLARAMVCEYCRPSSGKRSASHLTTR
jgi:hypothetical protein